MFKLLMNRRARIIFFILSLTAFLASDIMEIYYSYIFSDGLRFLRIILMSFGFLGLTLSLMASFFPIKKLTDEEMKKLAAKKKSFSTLLILFMILLFVGNIFLTSKLRDDRKERILRDEPTAIITARVIGINNHTSRHSNTRYVVLDYTYNNQRYQQEIRSGYQIGQEIHIKLSIENPLLFEVIRTPQDDSAMLNLLMKP